MKRDESWADFLARLQSHHGDDALACRHEIYFLQRRGCVLRAIAAMLRDIIILLGCPMSAEPCKCSIFALVTLAGPSGLSTINRALAQIPAGTDMRMLCHPRLNMTGGLKPIRPRFWQLVKAFKRGAIHLSSPIVAACVTRSHLWQAAWSNRIKSFPPVGITLFHNDFDLASRSLLLSLPPGYKTICIQHGIPTDEFFPAEAAVQVVWGKSSESAYRLKKFSGDLVVDSLGRKPSIAVSFDTPRSILLLSQTHTPIYGVGLKPWFESLAKILVDSSIPFSVLLHPGEVGQPRLYRNIPFSAVKYPPHIALSSAEPRSLIIGYSSTALFEAAAVGHFVAGLAWPVKASHAAHRIAQPPIICHDDAAVLSLFEKLSRKQSEREAHMTSQRLWLDNVFAPTGEFAHRISQWTA